MAPGKRGGVQVIRGAERGKQERTERRKETDEWNRLGI